jgi:Tol biopolymer transport system component
MVAALAGDFPTRSGSGSTGGRTVRRAFACTLATLVYLSAAAPAAAQYFGRNKVQVESFDFRILPTDHFDIYYYPAERDAALDAARMAERWYDRLSQALDHQLVERPPIILYASHAHFRQTTVVDGVLPDGIGGFTDHHRGRVVLPFAGGLGETDHVLGHELVHAFQRDILKTAGRSLALLPLWFVEGMAEYLSVGALDPNTQMWMRDAVDEQRLPTLAELDKPKWFPYRYGQALWVYLSGRFGDTLAARALRSSAKGGAIGRLTDVTGVDAATLSRDWHQSLKDAFGSANTSAERSSPLTVTVGAGKGAGHVNIAPALSPDGKQVVFLSERDGYSLDVFLADTASGTVTRKIVSTAADPHFDSLQFLESAGAWDRDGRRFALASLQNGHPVLTILDMPGGAVSTERAFAELDQMFSPTWSPDGTRIAFSAMRGGTSDLYVFDLRHDTLQRLTADAYADLQPAWSPDGRTIAFVSDRFTASLSSLTFGEYRLAALDVATGAVRALPFVPNVKHIDPQWHGDSLYFISDVGDVSNVYRLEVSTGELQQITDVREGVSGITALSPALSVSRDGRVAFSEYEGGEYKVRVIDSAAVAPQNIATTVNTHDTESEKVQSVVSSVVERVPAPKLASLDAKPYRPKMTLSGLGQPYLSAGGNMFGSFFRAGMSFGLSDLLEERQLQTAVQVGGTLADFAVQTAYVNRRSRWNWALIGGQIPIVIGDSRFVATEDAAAVPTLTRETRVARQIHRQFTGLAMYPFSASRRFEIGGGVHHIAFDREVATQVYSTTSGKLLREGKDTTSGDGPVTLIDTAAALVYDASVFGATAPVLGMRYRLEAAPTLGDLSFVTLTADYRRYLMPIKPLTIAFRAEHVGRYGSGASDPRLLPLVWTLRDQVRGYDPQDVVTTSRMTVANVEVRLPLVGPFGRLSGSTALPIDALLFGDAGALQTTERGRTLLRSVGAGIRLNAGGFVFEFDAVRPLDTMPRGWTLAINFHPGF